MGFVVDASLIVASLVPEVDTDTARLAMVDVQQAGAIAPPHLTLEVANALRMAVRRKRCSDAEVDDAVTQLLDLSIEDDRETAVHAWTTTLRLAVDHSLTLYDSAYLELAVRLRLPLASCDRDLIAAARRQQLEVVTP